MEASEPKFEDSAVPVTSTIRALEKEIAHPIVYQLVRVWHMNTVIIDKHHKDLCFIYSL